MTESPADVLARLDAEFRGQLLPLSFPVACRTSRATGARVRRHPVTIESNWSLSTGHDLNSERLAAALGGYLSCVDLADRVMPAARTWVELRLRTKLPEIARVDDRWCARTSASCCRAGYRDSATAAGHVRDRAHLARTADIDPRQLGGVTKHLSPLIDTLACPVKGRATRLLWASGLHPEWVNAVEQAVGLSEMPPQFHQAVLACQPDLTRLRQVLELAHCSEQKYSAISLTWMYNLWSQIPAGQWDDWLADAVSPQLSCTLAAAGYTVADARALRLALGGTVNGAAAVLAAWVSNGHRPSVHQLAQLAAVGIDVQAYSPAKNLVKDVRSRSAAPRTVSDTDIALTIMREGTAAATVHALKRQFTLPLKEG